MALSDILRGLAAKTVAPIRVLSPVQRAQARSVKASSPVPRRCIVFSSWVPEASLRLGRYYLKTLRRYHAETDIYMGINHGSSPAWMERVRQSGLKIAYGLVPKARHINSDAAGFIEALRLLKQSAEHYDTIWFAHTKGASYNNFNRSRSTRNYYEQHFWSQQERMEQVLLSEPATGLVASKIMINRAQLHNDHSDRLAEFYPFPFRSIGYFVVETFYVMRGSVVHEFLDRCPASFFNQNLVDDLGFDRWFFEAVFVSICDRMGCEPRALDEAQDLFLQALERWRRDKSGYRATAHAW